MGVTIYAHNGSRCFDGGAGGFIENGRKTPCFSYGDIRPLLISHI